MLTFLNLGRQGRMANMLFQVAGVVGIAIKSGQDYAFPLMINYDHRDRFKSDEDIDIYKYFKNSLPLLQNAEGFSNYEVKWGYQDIRLPSGNHSLFGFMQSEKYFAHCEDLIRHYFELKEPAQKMNIPEGSVAVHVRRTDYDGAFHLHLQKHYYDDAFKRLPQDHGNIYVFSDDPEKAKQLFDRQVTFVTGQHYMTDLYNMTECTHFIIANSAFSWWGAYLSKKQGKVVVAPRAWFGYNAGITSDDMYCSNWIIM